MSFRESVLLPTATYKKLIQNEKIIKEISLKNPLNILTNETKSPNERMMLYDQHEHMKVPSQRNECAEPLNIISPKINESAEHLSESFVLPKKVNSVLKKLYKEGHAIDSIPLTKWVDFVRTENIKSLGKNGKIKEQKEVEETQYYSDGSDSDVGQKEVENKEETKYYSDSENSEVQFRDFSKYGDFDTSTQDSGGDGEMEKNMVSDADEDEGEISQENISSTSTPKVKKRTKKMKRVSEVGGLGAVNTRAGKANVTRSAKKSELQKSGIKQQTGLGKKRVKNKNVFLLDGGKKTPNKTSHHTHSAKKSFTWLRY